MEILFSFIAILFSILTAVFSVKSRLRNRDDRSTKPDTNRGICSDRTGCDDVVSDSERLERDKDEIQELDERDAANIEQCQDIANRIREKEPETNAAE